MAEHLTETLLDNWPLVPGQTVQLSDDVQPGLAARIRLGTSGRRSVVFLWSRERGRGKERERFYEKLGPRVPKRFGVKEARAAAEKLNARLVLNEVTGKPRSDSAPTVTEAWGGFRKTKLHRLASDGETKKLRPRTLEGYDVSAKHFLRELGHWRIDRLTVEDVERLHQEITETAGPRPANAAVDLLGRLFRWWAVRSRNKTPDPTSIVERHRIEAREFKFVADEVQRFFKAAEQDPMRDLWILLAFTGVRRNNALQAHRDQFDLEARTWTIPAESAKGKRPIVVPITDEVVDIVQRRGDGLLFPARRGKGPLVNIKQDWQRLRKAADLPHWTPHTLRKLHATVARSSGLTPGQIADLLGHRALASQSAYAFGTEETVASGQGVVAGELRRLASPEGEKK